MNLKLATINFWGLPWPFSIKKKERLKLLMSLIDKEQFDIVALQEIWTNYDINTILKTCIGYNGFDKRNKIFNHSGLVLLSKRPLLNRFYFHFDGMLFNKEFPSRKGLLRADILLDSFPIQIINTHVYFDHNAEIEKKQQKQINQLINVLDQHPTILMGDFNRDHGSISLPTQFKLISQSSQSSISEKNKYSKILFNGLHFAERNPDHIYANFPVTIKKNYLIQNPIFSDHYPVVVELEM